MRVSSWLEASLHLDSLVNTHTVDFSKCETFRQQVRTLPELVHFDTDRVVLSPEWAAVTVHGETCSSYPMTRVSGVLTRSFGSILTA
jgi:hypothetical protein